MLSDQQRKKVFNTIILTQCLGMLSAAFFQNGFFLNYFSTLGISNAAIAFLFALPPLIGAVFLLPFAFLADRCGKLRIGLIGQVLIVVGLFVAMAAGWVERRLALMIVALLIFSVGGSLQGASWFALLNPIVPREIRGRFFGRLRVTFTTVSILFSLLIARMLGASESMITFQIIVGIVCLAHVVRFSTYARIPELEQEHKDTAPRTSFKESLAFVFQIKGFGAFNGYVLLITLFTAAIPLVYGLMQKDVFGLFPRADSADGHAVPGR